MQSYIHGVTMQCMLVTIALFTQSVQSSDEIISPDHFDHILKKRSIQQRKLRSNLEEQATFNKIIHNNSIRELISNGDSICVEDDKFIDFLGLTCLHHTRTYNCKLLGTIGYSRNNVQDVLLNCPRSCGLCITDIPTVAQTTEPTLAPTSWEYLASQSGNCLDNMAYRDKVGFGCKQHARTIDCKQIGTVGYTKPQVQKLLRNCPNSCKVCGLWNPSMSPSNHPTNFPNAIPSMSPSDLPSNFPSEIPSDVPSSVPTSVPSENPSFSPTTKLPTISPTMACRDSPDFKDYLGLSCKKHKYSVCGKTSRIGYPHYKVWELMMACPFSCGYCTTSVPSSPPSNFPSRSNVPSVFPSNIPTLYPSKSPSFSPSSFPSELPTLHPTMTCHDNKQFRDRLRLPCSHHQITPSCAKLSILGYSKKHVREVMFNCPWSCRYCESSPPSNLPSAAPTDYPTTSPTFVPTTQPTSSCHDALDFVDSRGLNCQKHKEIICDKITFLGYTEKEMLKIMFMCPLSCKICGTTERPSFISSIAPSSLPSSTCNDDPMYRDHNNFPCSKFKKFNCEKLHYVGFTMKQVSNLISHCPKSCNFC